MSSPSIHDDLPRHGSTGYGAEERAAAPPRLSAVRAVPPMEAEWLRVVGARPASGNGVHAGANGASNGASNGAATASPAAGNGPPAGGVDSTRGRH